MAQIKLSPQPYQIPAFTDFTTPIVGVSGGKRSGKSRLISCEKLLVASSLHPGCEFVLASPTQGMNRRNLKPLLQEIAQRMGIQFEGRGLNVSGLPPYVEIKWGDKVSRIHLDISIENFGRMNGLSLAGVYVDEIDKARPGDAEAFLEEALIRLSKPFPGRQAQLNVTGAPELNGYFYEFMVEKDRGDRKLYTWSMMDNMAISEDYKAAQMANIPPKKQPGWIRGEFMFNADSLVYDEFDPVENAHNWTMADALEADGIFNTNDIILSWDINDGGSSALLMVQSGKHIFVLQEWLKMQSTKHIVDKVKSLPWRNRVILTCDPASSQVLPYIQEAVHYGIRNRIMTAAPEVMHRVTAVNLRLGTKSLFKGVERRHLTLNPRTCRVTVNKCLMRQQYVRIGSENIPDKKTWIEEAGTDISGPLDALGYPTYMLFPYNPKNPSMQIRYR